DETGIKVIEGELGIYIFYRYRLDEVLIQYLAFNVYTRGQAVNCKHAFGNKIRCKYLNLRSIDLSAPDAVGDDTFIVVYITGNNPYLIIIGDLRFGGERRRACLALIQDRLAVDCELRQKAFIGYFPGYKNTLAI
ncbi:MAG TPA: hypothetical protein VLQ76_07720, partial [Bacteroidales bacterium]|nr:hypothetical protein [Bacteroidales bacterium]